MSKFGSSPGLRRRLWIGLILFPLLLSCSGPSPKADGGKEVEARQIQVLRRISRMEARVKARVEALPQVARVLVKVRPGKVLLLVAPARGGALDPAVVGKIRDIVFDETGLRGKSLVMRRWGKTGGS